ncbi:MAG TPA: ABC transporter permease, partial [Candidatus Sulfopaludibacter sp.]|nr:ABC transporter permease [Candidatus Sulfopaludibacter sp.]
MPVQNLRFAFRTLYRSRGVSAVAILTLALGIGAATTIFSVTDALLFHVFPYRDSGRLVLFRFHELRPAGYDGVASPPAAAVQDFRAANSSFEDIIGFWNARLPYITAGGAQQVDAAWVTPNAFAFLGVPAELGRGLLATDTAACVVSHAFWQQQLHADPKAIGTALDLNGVPRVL